MPRARIRLNRISPRRKQRRPGDDKNHLAMVRLLPCCICGVTRNIDAHHLLIDDSGMPKGMGRKNTDRWAISLCHHHHMALHRRGDEDGFLSGHGIDGRALARSLWESRGDMESMTRVVLNTLSRRRLK
jgi:hypothetical protein